jgi:hypothetical protein
MHAPTPVVTAACPVDVVEHLVEHDPLHEVPGHLRLIQRWMNPDHA